MLAIWMQLGKLANAHIEYALWGVWGMPPRKFSPYEIEFSKKFWLELF